MAVNIFPQNGDSGDETNFQDFLKYSTYPHVLDANHFEVEAATGLDVTVGSGYAILGGAVIELTSNATLTLPDNSSVLIYAEVDRSGGLLQNFTTDTDLFVVTSSVPSPPSTSERFFLASVSTASGSVQEVRDLRWLSPGNSMSVFNPGPVDTEVNNSTSLTEVDNDPLPIIAPGFGAVQFDLQFYFQPGNGAGVRWRFRDPLVDTFTNDHYSWTLYDVTGDAFLAAGDGGLDTVFTVADWTGGNGILRIKGGTDTGVYSLQLEFAQETATAVATKVVNNQTTMSATLVPNISYV